MKNDGFFCGLLQKSYLCTVFFIVLDLRLTKVGVQRYSFFCGKCRTVSRLLFDNVPCFAMIVGRSLSVMLFPSDKRQHIPIVSHQFPY